MCTKSFHYPRSFRSAGRTAVVLVACLLASGCQINKGSINPAVWRAQFGAENSSDEKIRKAAMEDDSFPSATQPATSSS